MVSCTDSTVLERPQQLEQQSRRLPKSTLCGRICSQWRASDSQFIIWPFSLNLKCLAVLLARCTNRPLASCEQTCSRKNQRGTKQSSKIPHYLYHPEHQLLGRQSTFHPLPVHRRTLLLPAQSLDARLPSTMSRTSYEDSSFTTTLSKLSVLYPSLRVPTYRMNILFKESSGND